MQIKHLLCNLLAISIAHIGCDSSSQSSSMSISTPEGPQAPAPDQEIEDPTNDQSIDSPQEDIGVVEEALDQMTTVKVDMELDMEVIADQAVVRDQAIDECAGVDCGAGGTCVEGDGERVAGQYTCNCAVGYEGGGINTACTDIDECAGIDCGAGGTCVEAEGEQVAGQYACNCAVGYEGGGINTACAVTPAPSPVSPVGHPTFMSPHARPIAVVGDLVYVVNTPGDTLDVINVNTEAVVRRIQVGIDPVSVAARPDGLEVWVTNHVSDSVSVVDTDLNSPTLHQVLATVQDLDFETRATRFDEPVGVVFASNEKAYVALSSENRIAVVDVTTRTVSGHLVITAQDPRAMTVRGDRLYVIPFESGNQTQISGCYGELPGAIDGDLCTFDVFTHGFPATPNTVLSLGIDVDVVRHPAAQDRDLFVFDTTTDTLVETVSTLGTLLYGVAVDSTGKVFIAQTEARNYANGRASQGDGLPELDNRAFLNQISTVDCSSGNCSEPSVFELEPLPPNDPPMGMALATPFAIKVSDDDSTLVVTAAGSNKLFTVDAQTGEVLGRVAVDAVPRGIALESNVEGAPSRAWVLNAVENTVSIVDVSDTSSPVVNATIALDDPTHPIVKSGRKLFHNANGSTNGTFSCESCHPDGHADQLLWVLDTPVCGVGDEVFSWLDESWFSTVDAVESGCAQVQPRSTMPTRGLRDTAPYHWDGIPGDPYGGINATSVFSHVEPNCDSPHSCILNLVDGSLATTMCDTGDCPTNNEGKRGAFSAAERDDLAAFLLTIPYPPAQRRSFDNELSTTALDGFRKFHIEGLPREGSPNVCGSCHRMPFWVSTNNFSTGMDASTFRGAYDRWLILTQGRTFVADVNNGSGFADLGLPEHDIWAQTWGNAPTFDAVWNMALEGSTGTSGSFARQVTLNTQTADDADTLELLSALEQSDSEGAVVLQVEGVFLTDGEPTYVAFEYDGNGDYVQQMDGDGSSYATGQLVAAAQAGTFRGTFTARLGTATDLEHPQPSIWTESEDHTISKQPEVFPRVSATSNVMRLRGRHLSAEPHVIVDGRRVYEASISCIEGDLSDCQTLTIQLTTLPEPGMHMLQLQNPGGFMSNDFIFHVD